MKRVMVLSVMLLCSLGYTGLQAQDVQNFNQEDFDRMVSVFNKNLKTYLEKFVKMQYPPGHFDDKPDSFISSVKIYEAKASGSANDLKEEFIKKAAEGNTEINIHYMMGSFEFLYKFEFPGLDYLFFEKCRKEIFPENYK